MRSGGPGVEGRPFPTERIPDECLVDPRPKRQFGVVWATVHEGFIAKLFSRERAGERGQ
jgi:hypothetical protein